MTEREIRIRAIEALSTMGVREPTRIIKEAEMLASWVMAGDDKGDTPSRRPTAKTD